MKQLNTYSQPQFNPTAQTLDFSAWPNFNISKLYAVINVTQNQPLYVAGAPGLGISSIAGSVLTLAYNTQTYSTSDKINVYYEAAQGVESNALAERGGVLQDSQETLNQILVELKVHSLILAQGLNINVDDVESIRNDITNQVNQPSVF